MSALKGKVQTVTGTLRPEELGVVMPHEYTLTGEWRMKEAEFGKETDLANLTFQMKNLGKIRQFPYSVKANLCLDSKEDAVRELELYRSAGGTTICDVAPKSLRLSAEVLPWIASQSGVNIVAGTAYYAEPYLTSDVRNMTIQQVCGNLVREITEGIEGSGGVRCGFIGEMGCSHPLTPAEEKGLRAAALAQQRTGAPLCVHPGIDEQSPFRILDVLEEAGADISCTVVAHLDRTIFNEQQLLKLARRGCYLEYDLFGIECSHYQVRQSKASIDYPSDAQRIKKVKCLLDNGHVDQVLISMAIHTKHRLVKYGGHGYAHILEHIVPKMKERGISEQHIGKIIRDNPQRWLTFK